MKLTQSRKTNQGLAVMETDNGAIEKCHICGSDSSHDFIEKGMIDHARTYDKPP